MPLIPRETALLGLKQAEEAANYVADQIKRDVEGGDYSLAVSRLAAFRKQLEELNDRTNKFADVYGG